MQALFCIDMLENGSEKLIEQVCAMMEPAPEVVAFCLRLVNGVLENREAIDRIIEEASSNWKISRMACVDRNLIRMAVYELLYCNDIPPRVTINEAVDIGKKYSTEESGAFINGVLDSICKKHLPGFPEHQDMDIENNRSTPTLKPE